MARQRMIKPEFFDSESLADCSIAARLAFIGLWVMGDDYGRQKAQVRRLRTRIFPFDKMTDRKFAGLLSELEDAGCIKGYEIDGERYVYIPNFEVYQTINRPSKSSIPEPPKDVEKLGKTTIFSEGSMSTHPERKKEVKKDCLVFQDKTRQSQKEEKGASVASASGENPAAPLCPTCGSEAEQDAVTGMWYCNKCSIGWMGVRHA